MSSGFKIFEKSESSVSKLRFDGSMDEHSDYGKIEHSLQDTVMIDFASITHINSTGIKHWIAWHSKVQQESPNVKFSFINCPKSFIDQVNMVEGFLPKNSKVESFKVPYYCETCGKDFTATFLRGREFREASSGLLLEVPSQTCNREDCEMEPDVVEKKYFSFLNKT